jgi:hypothetical protein
MCFSLACDLDIAFGTIYVIVQDWIDLTTQGLEKEIVFASLINLLFSSPDIILWDIAFKDIMESFPR